MKSHTIADPSGISGLEAHTTGRLCQVCPLAAPTPGPESRLFATISRKVAGMRSRAGEEAVLRSTRTESLQL